MRTLMLQKPKEDGPLCRPEEPARPLTFIKFAEPRVRVRSLADRSPFVAASDELLRFTARHLHARHASHHHHTRHALKQTEAPPSGLATSVLSSRLCSEQRTSPEFLDSSL